MTIRTFPTLPWPSLPFKRTTIWQTLPMESVAGIVTAQQPWSYPRYRYSLSGGWLRDGASYLDLQTFQGFFNLIGGKAQLFKYNDTSDNASAADEVFGIGDGVTTTFQLLRVRGGFVEPVFATNTITNVKVNGVTKVLNTDYTVSAYGIVTFAVAPAISSSLTWTGTFYWYCRFDQDELDFEKFVAALDSGWGGTWVLSQLAFTTQKFGTA